MLTYLQTVPVLRSFDEGRTRAFYVGFLGFAVDWEHRFEPGMPLYMQVSRDGIRLHLSEHHGDGSPGARVRIEVASGLRAFHAEITGRGYSNARPGLERPDWGGLEVSVMDPVGNMLIFWERAEIEPTAG